MPALSTGSALIAALVAKTVGQVFHVAVPKLDIVLHVG